MGKIKDLTGQIFGRLTVLNRAENNKWGSPQWICGCDCGNTKTIQGYMLTSGKTQSCGCLHKEMLSERSFKDLVGQQFGRLTVLRRVENKGNNTAYECSCSCNGKLIIVASQSLRSGATKSCGCYRQEHSAKIHLVHGHKRRGKITKEYRAWIAMIQRCTNPKYEYYYLYGERGIRVCEAWFLSFEQFLADVGYAPSPKHSLDRIDNNGNYEPGNVRWATWKEQNNNKRSNHLITHNGKTQTLMQWSEEKKIPSPTLYSRRRAGRSIEQILASPVSR